jgi:hypothetical protein
MLPLTTFSIREGGREWDLSHQSWAEPWRVKVVEPLRIIRDDDCNRRIE